MFHSVLVTCAEKRFPTDKIPMIYDTYKSSQEVNGELIEFTMWDTAGRDYRLRPLSYIETDLFVLCFSVTNLDSFENIRLKWYPEVKHYTPDAEILLLGTKQDLRTDEKTIEQLNEYETIAVQWDDAQNLAESIGAIGYMECSAKEDLYSIERVFEQILLCFDSLKQEEPYQITLHNTAAKSARK